MRGPLSVGVAAHGGGGSSVDAPPRVDAYTATFGSFVLCSTDPDAGHITLTGVNFPTGAPAGVTPWIRQVTPAQVQHVPARKRASYIPYSFGLGAPPAFDEAYAGLRPPGSFTRNLTSVTVDTTCKETSNSVVALNKGTVPSVGYDELMVVVPATSDGADLRGFTINYTADGDDYSLKVPWTMVVCDTAGTLPHC